MKPAPIPSDDLQRLQALRELLILDTPPEERFDRVTAFAAGEFDVPICVISLVDENRQWFKARVGVDVCETPRDVSFCGHALEQSDVLLVEDTRQDERFHDNPLVTGEPHIRFYAGAPLVLASGHVAGTLCIIDTKPRQIDALDLAILGSLRDLVVAELQGQAGVDEGTVEEGSLHGA
jgi:GAF domain-containing protein